MCCGSSAPSTPRPTSKARRRPSARRSRSARPIRISPTRSPPIANFQRARAPPLRLRRRADVAERWEERAAPQGGVSQARGRRRHARAILGKRPGGAAQGPRLRLRRARVRRRRARPRRGAARTTCDRWESDPRSHQSRNRVDRGGRRGGGPRLLPRRGANPAPRRRGDKANISRRGYSWGSLAGGEAGSSPSTRIGSSATTNHDDAAAEARVWVGRRSAAHRDRTIVTIAPCAEAAPPHPPPRYYGRS